MTKDRTINQLRRKFALLIEYDYYEDLSAIAKALGTKLKTMESWADSGTDKFTPGLVPAKHYSDIVRLFDVAMGQTHSLKETKAIVHGDVAAIEQWLKPAPSLGLAQIIERDAILSTSRLFIEKQKPIGAVSRRSELNPATQHIVGIDDWFRMEFQRLLKDGNAIAIQHSRRHWVSCPIYSQMASSTLLLPGIDDNGQTDWMQEREWQSLNRFIVIEVQALLPNDIMRVFENSAPLDSSLLQRIADYYELQPIQGRGLSLIEVDVRDY